MRNDQQATIALVYCRISSEAQARKGDGLRSQETRCREYCSYKGVDVERVFYDRAISGKLIDRPGIKELIQFLKRSKVPQDYVVVFDDISRLARDIRAYLDLRDAIFDTGAQMDSPNMDFRQDSDGRYFEGMQALNAEHARRKIAETSKNRMWARLTGGYWCFAAPLGYKFEKHPSHGNLLVRNEPIASIIQVALEGFATGRFETQAEVKRYLESEPDFVGWKKGRTVRYEDVVRLLTRHIYSGTIEYPAWNISLRKGHHEGLISLENFERIQQRIKEGARVPARKDINAEFPLRGFITCGDCNNPMTSCFSKSKTGTKHPYYMCFTKTCDSYRKSIKRDALEGEFETLLKQMKPSGTLFNYLRIIFKREWELRLASLNDLKKTLRRDILKLDKQIDNLMDKIVDAESNTAITAYERRIARLEKDKLIKAEKLENGTTPQRTFEEMFELALTFLANPWKLWASTRLEDKRTVLKLAFDAPLAYCRKQGLRTPKTTIPFNILGDINMGKCKMAERKGFEPSRRFLAYALSRGAPSTTRPPLRRRGYGKRCRRSRRFIQD